jgi:hypothetical protein
MTPDAPIEIARNKKKLAYFLAGGLLVFLFGLFMVLDPKIFTPPSVPSTFVAVAVGMIIIVATGIFCYIMAVRMASVFPGMIISDKDIYDHTGSPGDGLISWEDITEITENRIRGIRHLTIVVKNPKAYIDRQRNPVKRQFLNRTNEQYGSPIQIAASDLDFDFERLKALLQTRLEKFRSRSPAY